MPLVDIEEYFGEGDEGDEGSDGGSVGPAVIEMLSDEAIRENGLEDSRLVEHMAMRRAHYQADPGARPGQISFSESEAVPKPLAAADAQNRRELSRILVEAGEFAVACRGLADEVNIFGGHLQKGRASALKSLAATHGRAAQELDRFRGRIDRLGAVGASFAGRPGPVADELSHLLKCMQFGFESYRTAVDSLGGLISAAAQGAPAAPAAFAEMGGVYDALVEDAKNFDSGLTVFRRNYEANSSSFFDI